MSKQLQCTALAREFSRSWFGDLRRRVIEERQPYVLASAETPHEIFEVLGLPVVTAEWWSGVVSAKRRAGAYLDWMNAHGLHEGLGGYNTLGLVSLMAPEVPDAPWGGLPPPALLCTPNRSEAGARAYAMAAGRLNVPCFTIDVPAATRFYPRWWEMARREWDDLYERHRVDIMLEQFRDLIAAAEAIAGRRLDLDALRARLEAVNRQEEAFDAARETIVEAEKCPVSLDEQMSNVMTAQWHRGTGWAVSHAQAFRDEVQARAAAGEAACAGERIRLMWVGNGLWQNTAFYRAFEDSHGAVFVWSMYLAIAADGYIKYGLHDPVRALAARYLNLGEQMHVPPWAGEWVVHEGLRHRVQGAVMLAPPASRTALAGNRFQMLALEKAGIPVLEVTLDPNDNRAWDEARLRGQVARFIEERIAA